MKSKIYLIIAVSSILAFAIIVDEKIIGTFENALAQTESWDIDETPSVNDLGNDTGATGWNDLDNNTTETTS
jgi:hypothetical protein